MTGKQITNQMLDHLKSVEAKMGGDPIDSTTSNEHIYALKLLTKVGNMKNDQEKEKIRKELINIMCNNSEYGYLFTTL